MYPTHHTSYVCGMDENPWRQDSKKKRWLTSPIGGNAAPFLVQLLILILIAWIIGELVFGFGYDFVYEFIERIGAGF